MPIHNSIHLQQNSTNPSQPAFGPASLQAIGPTVQVELTIPEELARYFEREGIPIPGPVTGIALIDTGASITAVDRSIISKLQISPIGVTTVYTPQGSAEQEIFPIKLTFAGSPIFVNFSQVLGSDLISQGIFALIGRDVLSSCVLVYNGPLSHYSLSV